MMMVLFPSPPQAAVPRPMALSPRVGSGGTVLPALGVPLLLGRGTPLSHWGGTKGGSGG